MPPSETSNQQSSIQEERADRISKAYEKHIERKGKLEILTGLLGYNALEKHNRQTDKNKEAENRWVRENIFGCSNEDLEDDEEMGPINILGDVNHPHSHSQITGATNPPPQNPPQRSRNRGLNPLVAGILGAAIPGAGIGGVLLDRFLNDRDKPVPAVKSDDDNLGIGIIEDYLSE